MATKEEWDEFEKEIKKYGYVSSGIRTIWVILVAILGLSFFGLGLYGGTHGWLKSQTNITLTPNTTQEYSFSTPIQNSYSFQPYNNFSIYINGNLCNNSNQT